jgi:hypothetical protein
VKGSFCLDDERSWPSEVLSLLNDALPLLKMYSERESQIERAQRGDVLLRINPALNEYQFDAEGVSVDVGTLLEGFSVIGWHCARLCDDEVQAIVNSGMYPLSPESFALRLSNRIARGDIDTDAAARFQTEHEVESIHRQMLWFVFDRDCLRGESGVGRLFTSWGGEALYGSHEEDEQTGPLLRSIGTPCIVEAALPLDVVSVHARPGEWLMRAFLSQRGVRSLEPPKCDGHIREVIGRDSIRRVISFSDVAFEELTGASGWTRYPLTGA